MACKRREPGNDIECPGILFAIPRKTVNLGQYRRAKEVGFVKFIFAKHVLFLEPLEQFHTAVSTRKTTQQVEHRTLFINRNVKQFCRNIAHALPLVYLEEKFAESTAASTIRFLRVHHCYDVGRIGTRSQVHFRCS